MAKENSVAVKTIKELREIQEKIMKDNEMTRRQAQKVIADEINKVKGKKVKREIKF